jgi:CRISPR/Cas system CSM-associated protein Csm3 (group 7 of RAMP superfamily)
MLRVPLNECTIDFEFTSTTPMLVKDGRWQPKKGEQLPAAVFQCREDLSATSVKRDIKDENYGGLTFFIPGATLRGVFRSQMERIARGLSPDDPIVCNPFVDESEALSAGATEMGCSWRAKKGYADSCPVCRIFGSTKHAGRITFQDGERVAGTGQVKIAEQIAIDRFTGSVRTGLGPFKLMTLVGATFTTRIVIRNFELWQLGLLGYVFKDLKHARLQMGMGRNLDRGHVKCEYEDTRITVTYFGLKENIPADGVLSGIGELWKKEAGKYRFVMGESIAGQLDYVTADEDGFAHEHAVKETEAFWRVVTPKWNEAAKDREIFPGRAAEAKRGA